MSFAVAVRPASAFSLKKPFFSSRVRARASLVVSLGTATLTLSSLATAEAASEEAAALEAVEDAVEEEPPQAVRAAAAAATPVTFRKIATSNHGKIPLYLCEKIVERQRGTVRARLAGGRKKPPSLHEPNAQQGRRHNIFRGTTLVYSVLTDKASMLRQLLLLTAGRCNGRIPLQT